MRIVKEISAIVFWLGLWIVIPAAVLYPVVLWTTIHADISQERITNLYMVGIGLLFLPTGFLVDLVHRRFRVFRNPREPHQDPTGNTTRITDH